MSATTPRALAGAAALVVAVAAWLWLGPTQLGGPATYAVVVGTSMEPKLERGDLVVVREQKAYRPGDVVLYGSRTLGEKVLHRIVRVDADGRYVLRGDNNGFVDPERPARDQLLGTLALRVPHAGHATQWLREPMHAALLVGLTTLFALGGGGAAGAAVLRRRIRPSPRAGRRTLPPQLAPVLAAVAAASLAATVLLFRLPATETAFVAEDAQRVDVAYHARVAKTPVYPAGSLGTRDVVFVRLVPRLRVRLDYRSDDPWARGVLALDLRVADGRGWARTLPVAADASFRGGHGVLEGTLDVRRLRALVDRVRELTGLPQATYAVTLVPTVRLDGAVAPEPVRELPFELDAHRLQPAAAAPFEQRLPVAREVRRSAELALGPVVVPVDWARRAGLAVLGLALTAVGALAVTARRRLPQSEPARIAAAHGHRLVEIASAAGEPRRCVDVASMEDLVRISEHYDRFVLHSVVGGRHEYLVNVDGTVHRYCVGRPVAPEGAPLLLHRRSGAPAR